MKIAGCTALLVALLALGQTASSSNEATNESKAQPEAKIDKDDVAKMVKRSGLTQEVFEKLSSDQLFELLKQQNSVPEVPLVATVSSVAFFATVIMLVGLGLYVSLRKDRQRHETLRLLVEKGAAIPPELLIPPVKKNVYLTRGLVLLSTGIGLAVLLLSVDDEPGSWTIGLIPLLIGAAYLIVWKLEKRDEESATSNPRSTA